MPGLVPGILHTVIPAQAGIQSDRHGVYDFWIPAFAGMTRE
jgi:hypothetical protein